MSRGAQCLGPNVAGSWYPADQAVLARQLDALLAAPAAVTPGEGSSRIRAMIAPHAGYAYSGSVAARGFRRLRDARPARILLLGPSHYADFTGAAVPTAECYRTPLGDVPIDGEAVARLERARGVQSDDGPFLREHSLEAEIPFLQRCLAPGWRIVPVLLGRGTSGEVAERIAAALSPLFDADTLVVASSDFTHYGPRFGYVPFDRDVPERIDELDRAAIELILAGDVQGFESYVERTGATICGRDAIGVLLRLAPGRLAGTLAAYDTSGRITGSWDHSVSYASLVFREQEAG